MYARPFDPDESRRIEAEEDGAERDADATWARFEALLAAEAGAVGKAETASAPPAIAEAARRAAPDISASGGAPEPAADAGSQCEQAARFADEDIAHSIGAGQGRPEDAFSSLAKLSPALGSPSAVSARRGARTPTRRDRPRISPPMSPSQPPRPAARRAPDPAALAAAPPPAAAVPLDVAQRPAPSLAGAASAGDGRWRSLARTVGRWALALAVALAALATLGAPARIGAGVVAPGSTVPTITWPSRPAAATAAGGPPLRVAALSAPRADRALAALVRSAATTPPSVSWSGSALPAPAAALAPAPAARPARLVAAPSVSPAPTIRGGGASEDSFLDRLARFFSAA